MSKMTKYLQLTTTETLSFWDDYIEDYVFNPENKLVTTSWYKLPDDWLNAGKLKEDKLEAIFKNLYGENWRQGNDDGSKFRVLGVEENLLSDTQSLQKPWLNEKRFCYVISEDDSIKKCEPEGF